MRFLPGERREWKKLKEADRTEGADLMEFHSLPAKLAAFGRSVPLIFSKPDHKERNKATNAVWDQIKLQATPPVGACGDHREAIRVNLCVRGRDHYADSADGRGQE
ncbi:hypothetical protein AOLI_G00115270 [Acnodon oligacanthus]